MAKDILYVVMIYLCKKRSRTLALDNLTPLIQSQYSQMHVAGLVAEYFPDTVRPRLVNQCVPKNIRTKWIRTKWGSCHNIGDKMKLQNCTKPSFRTKWGSSHQIGDWIKQNRTKWGHSHTKRGFTCIIGKNRTKWVFLKLKPNRTKPRFALRKDALNEVPLYTFLMSFWFRTKYFVLK